MSARILNISYDATLLNTRTAMLEAEGYGVSSTLRFAEAIDACRSQSFDLVIIGHSIPDTEKQQFVNALHLICSTPVLALRRPNEGNVAGADYDFDISTGPEELMATVRSVLYRRRAAKP